MKNAFKEFARLNGNELKNFFDNTVIVFDTNVLLCLYSFTSKTRRRLLDMMEDLTKQLWIPHKVAEEFYCTRSNKIGELNTFSKNVIGDLDAILNKYDTSYCFYSELETGIKTIKSNINKVVSYHRKDFNKDDIVDTLEKLFDGKVGKKYSDEQYKKLEDEYQQKNGCPGSKDKNKKTNSSGDYIIWNQMLDYAKQTGKNLIFVTNDQKEDLWKSVGNDIKVPKPELLIEFKEKTNGKLIQIYNLDKFFDVYNKQKTKKIDTDITNEIKALISSREKIVNRLKKALNSDKHMRSLEEQSLSDWLSQTNYFANRLNSARKVSENNAFLQSLEACECLKKYSPRVSDDIDILIEKDFAGENNK